MMHEASDVVMRQLGLGVSAITISLTLGLLVWVYIAGPLRLVTEPLRRAGIRVLIAVAAAMLVGKLYVLGLSLVSYAYYVPPPEGRPEWVQVVLVSQYVLVQIILTLPSIAMAYIVWGAMEVNKSSTERMVREEMERRRRVSEGMKGAGGR